MALHNAPPQTRTMANADKAPRMTQKRLEEAARQRRVAELYLQKKTQSEIAGLLGVDQSTVSRDIHAIEEGWAKDARTDLNAAKVRELARIDALEREYWLAWERSQRDGGHETTIVEGGRERSRTTGEVAEVTGKVKRTAKKHSRDGNHYFLAGIQWCIEQRVRILGLDRLAQSGEGEAVKALLDSLADLREQVPAPGDFAPVIEDGAAPATSRRDGGGAA